MTSGWTTVDQLVATLKRRWDRGQYATARAAGQVFEPVSVPVRSPGAADVVDRFDEVRRWAETFERESTDRHGRPCVRIEYRTVQSRRVGANQLPARVWVDSIEQLCQLIGTTQQLRDLDRLVTRTAEVLPAAAPWVAGHPLVAVAHRDVWDRLLATVAWIDGHPTKDLYLRQLDVKGVDTKFVERHRKILDELLTVVLPPERVDPGAPRADFVSRFRFRSKPEYVRLRFLSPQAALPAAITEVRLRADELPATGIRASTVFVVENEISYLALPDVPGAVAIFGSGYGLEAANAGAWFSDKEVVYWGDIDTHGFAILDGLRTRLPAVSSILMDSDTLLGHPEQWVSEPAPTSRHLAHLTVEEASLYRDLVEDRYGKAVRLEQERVRFALVRQALHFWQRG